MMNNVTDIAQSSNLGTRARRAAVHLVTALARLGRDTRGATMVEYAVLVGLISAGAITLIVATGDTMSKPWSTLTESLPGMSDGTVPGDTAAADGPAATGEETGGGSSGDGTSVADGADTGGDSSPNGGGQGGDTGDSGEFDVAAVPSGGGASSGGGGGSAAFGDGGTSGASGAGSSGGGQSGGSAATSGGGQSSGSAATSGGGGGSAGTSVGGGGGAGGGGSAGSTGLAGGYGASGGGASGGGAGGGGSQGGAGAAMTEADPAPYGAAETETGTMQASLVWQAKSLGNALLAEGASGEMGATLLAMGGQGAGTTVAVLEDMAQGKHPWLALLFALTLIAAFYAIAKRTKSARFKKRMLAIADHRWD